MRRAFTLIEMLCTITVVGILMAMLTPALKAVIKTNRTLMCSVNLQSLYQGVEMYRSDFKGLYPYATVIADIRVGNLEPYLAMASYEKAAFPSCVNYQVHTGSPWRCPEDRQTTGFSYIYGPYDLMAAWDSLDPQYAVSKILEQTPDELLFLDDSPRHFFRQGSTALIRCNGSMRLREKMPP